MFDVSVMKEGLGQAEAAHRRSAVHGPSPDGLGAYVEPAPEDANYPFPDPTDSSPNPPPISESYHARAAYQPMHGEIDFLEPDNTSAGAATRSAGFTLLLVALTTGIGYAWKGGLGAATGLLVSAGAANIYRAQKWFEASDPSEKHEAIVSSVFAVGELGAGAYVGYQAYKLGESPIKK